MSTFHEEWEQYKPQGCAARKNFKKGQTKGKYVAYITTQRVSFNGKKYETCEERQNIMYKDHLDYDKVFRKIKKFYTPKLLSEGKNVNDYTLTIVIGLLGPRVFTTDELMGKTNFFALFEVLKDNPPCTSIPTTSGMRNIYTSASHKAEVEKASGSSSAKSSNPCCTKTQDGITKSERDQKHPASMSMCPKSFDRSAILAAAHVVSEEASVHRVKVQSFERINGKWMWLPKFNAKFVFKNNIGNGAFRIAYDTQFLEYENLPIKKYVVKTWKREVVNRRMGEYARFRVIKSELDIQIELSKRACQTQAVARNVTKKFQETLKKGASATTVKNYVKYIPTFVAEGDDAWYTLEPKMEGLFIKYLNNDMKKLLHDSDIGEQVAALAHFSLYISKKAILLTDIQGCGYCLSDPEIATASSSFRRAPQLDEFGIGNLAEHSFTNFIQSHKCNKYCHMCNLKPLNMIGTEDCVVIEL